MVDARLADGSRVNAIIPPLALDGPAMSIRRFMTDRLGANDLVARDSWTEPMKEFLQAAVACRLNLIVSGGTGSGKTTLLNILSGYIGGTERVVTIEDAAELMLRQRHVVRLETRPANIEGKGAVRARELVVNALRMRPDRIIVGEVRGPEAFDLLQAMNTGHDGSMGTLHSNSPRECISRLESMILMGGFNLPARSIREMIVSSVDIIVQAQRLRDGSRKIMQVTEVIGMEGDVVTLQDLFLYEIQGEDANKRLVGRHRSTGIARPRFWEKARYFGEEERLGQALAAGEVQDEHGRPLGERHA